MNISSLSGGGALLCTALLNGHSIGDGREDRAGLKRKMSKTENCKVKLRSLTVIYWDEIIFLFNMKGRRFE